MVGLIDDLKKRMTLDFKKPGDHIILLGETMNDFAGSEYLHRVLGVQYSPAPWFDIDEEIVLQESIRSLIEKDTISSATDLSEGGLFVAIMESCFHRGLGFEVEVKEDEVRKDAFWFGESQSRALISVSEEQYGRFLRAIDQCKVSWSVLGVVTSGAIIIDGENWGNVEPWKQRYDTAIENLLQKESEAEAALGML
jgi:phosphoribosylformylglycinamidine synthase subunit PurL